MLCPKYVTVVAFVFLKEGYLIYKKRYTKTDKCNLLEQISEKCDWILI